MSTPRIYVACLAAYNNAKLHGKWIDVGDVDALKEEIHEVLKTSPEPNVQKRDAKCPDCGEEVHITLADRTPAATECPTCHVFREWTSEPYPSSEEWAVHDYEGFEGVELGEYPDLVKVVSLAEAIETHGDAFVGYLQHLGGLDQLDSATENFTDAYRGTWDSVEAYAENFTEDTGELKKVPEHLQRYIDFKAMGRDWELGGDIFAVDAEGGKVHIFDGTI